MNSSCQESERTSERLLRPHSRQRPHRRPRQRQDDTAQGAAAAHRASNGTMVLVNELGEVGIDHHLVEHASESTLLLGERLPVLRDARRSQDRAERPALAPRGAARFRATSASWWKPPGSPTRCRSPTRCWPSPCSSTTTVWATSSPWSTRSTPAGQLDRFAESVKQVALADRLVVSKLDIAGPGALEALRHAACEDQPGRARRRSPTRPTSIRSIS